MIKQLYPAATSTAAAATPALLASTISATVNPPVAGDEDSYVTWQATPKLTFAVEGDYLIERLWRNSAPGRSSAPSHVDGGAAYVRYQFTPKIAVATRFEYLSDRGGLFSGITQALKENTVTFDYMMADGFLMRYEWRRDYSNQPSFLSDVQGLLVKQQNTATLGVVWWWGRKEDTW
jgi:Putative beta-barrel porin-2, OmpL-like. bbp2